MGMHACLYELYLYITYLDERQRANTSWKHACMRIRLHVCVAKKVPNVLHVSANNRLLKSVSCLEIGKFLDTVNK